MLTVFLVLFSAYRINQQDKAEYEDKVVKARFDYERILSLRDLSQKKPTQPSLSIHQSYYPSRDSSHPPILEQSANLEVSIISSEPAKCVAWAVIVDSREPLRNLRRNYEIKWQGTQDATITLEPDLPRTLNVVGYGRPPMPGPLKVFGGGPFVGLHFMTAGTHTPRGYFTEGSVVDLLTRTVDSQRPTQQRIVLKVVVAAWSLYNEAIRSYFEQHYLISKQGDFLAMEPIPEGTIPVWS